MLRGRGSRVKSRYQSLALYRGQAYVPTIGEPPSGTFWEVDPVAVVEASEAELAPVLTERLAQGHVRIKEWYRGDPPRKSVVQVAARSRSWIGFARRSVRFSLFRAEAFWSLGVGEGPQADYVENHHLPLEATGAELTRAILAVAAQRPLWRG
jgi:hypothetical protein